MTDKPEDAAPANRADIEAAAGVDLSSESSDSRPATPGAPTPAPEAAPQPRRSVVQLQAMAMRRSMEAISEMALTLAKRPECADVAGMLGGLSSIAEAAAVQCEAFVVMGEVMSAYAQGAKPAPPSSNQPATFGRKTQGA